MLLKDQFPTQFNDWLNAAGGTDKVLDDRFRLWCLATGVIPVTVDDAKAVGEDLATAFNQYNRVILSLPK